MLNREVEVLWVSRFDYNKGSSLGLHNHPYYQLIYILDGTGRFCINGVWHEICKQFLFLMKPGDEHGLEADPTSKIKTLDIKFAVHSPVLVQALDSMPGQTTSKDTEIIHLLEKIRKEGQERRNFIKEMSSLHLAEMLLILLREKKNLDTTISNKDIKLPDENVSVFEQI